MVWLMKFDQSCVLKPPNATYPSHPYPISHSSPAHAPATPCIPLHCCVLIHLSSLEVLLCKLPLSAHLLVGLILVRSTNIDQVLRRVRDNVVGSPVFLDRDYLASLKLVELLLLRGRPGGNRLKAGGYEHVRFVLWKGRCGGAAD